MYRYIELLLATLAIFANAFLIVFIIKRKPNRTFVNIFIVTTAVVDTSFFILLIFLHQNNRTNFFHLGLKGCQIASFLSCTCYYSSMFLFPVFIMTYLLCKEVKLRKIVVISALTFVVPIVFSFHFAQFVEHFYHENKFYCVFDVTEELKNLRILVLLSELTLYLVVSVTCAIKYKELTAKSNLGDKLPILLAFIILCWFPIFISLICYSLQKYTFFEEVFIFIDNSSIMNHANSYANEISCIVKAIFFYHFREKKKNMSNCIELVESENE